MKKTHLILLLMLFSSCNDYLDVVPDNIATVDYAFYDRVGAEKFLFTCYSYLPNLGSPAGDPAIMGGDELLIHGKENYYSSDFGSYNAYNIKFGEQNVNNPLLNFWDGQNNGRGLFIAIRDCNIFLESVHLVGKDLDDQERDRWIAEVKFLKAYYHYYLLRMYGPIPLIRENLPISASTDEVRVFRDPFDEGVQYIVQLLNEAVPDLPLEILDRTTELGRITQPVALALKAELLVTAASPLYNGNSAYSGLVDQKGIQLFNTTYDENKWKVAMEACKNAIDTALLANHRLYIFNDPRYQVGDTTQRVMSLRNAFGERWNTEVIWGISKNTTGYLQTYSMPYFTLNDVSLAKTQPILSPTLKTAEMFYSENGVPIDEDTRYNYEGRYETSLSTEEKFYIAQGAETANLNQHREPRFYANLGFDGGVWFGNGRYKDVGMGDVSETSWLISALQGETSGKTSSLRYSATGYFVKKYSHFETVTTATALTLVRMAFPAIRLADLYLLYAEACNEYYGPNAETYQYLDLVRERAGLKGVIESWSQYSRYPDKPLNKEGLREIVRQERMNELAFEGKRFWDLRRWKIADEELNQVARGWNVKASTAVEYYHVVSLQSLVFTTKDYLWPLQQATLRTNPNLVQNPFWDN